MATLTTRINGRLLSTGVANQPNLVDHDFSHLLISANELDHPSGSEDNEKGNWISVAISSDYDCSLSTLTRLWWQ